MASSSLPSCAVRADFKRILVAPEIAESTTMGVCARSLRTISITVRIDLASSTEVPPNFITIIFMTLYGLSEKIVNHKIQNLRPHSL